MSVLADPIQPTGSAIAEALPARPAALEAVARAESDASATGHLLSTILTTSVGLHLLLIGYLGFGTPTAPAKLRVVKAEAPPPPVVENIQLEAPPPPPPKAALPLAQDQPQPAPDDLPAPAVPVAAVPANVAVAFALKVVGPVRIVSDTAQASGGGLPALSTVPQEAAGRNLLTPPTAYPAEARYKHWTGRAVVEFRTTATGDIVDVKIRSSSGYDVLDKAALDNLRLGRWTGEAGYFTKTYDFILR